MGQLTDFPGARILQSDLATVVLLLDEGIVFEESAPRLLSLFTRFAHTVLHAVLPLPFVPAAVGPLHMSVSMTYIVEVAARIDVSTRPYELPLPVLPVVEVVTFVAVSTLNPHSVAVS